MIPIPTLTKDKFWVRGIAPTVLTELVHLDSDRALPLDHVYLPKKGGSSPRKSSQTPLTMEACIIDDSLLTCNLHSFGLSNILRVHEILPPSLNDFFPFHA